MQQVDAQLASLLPETGPAPRLVQAMRYSLLNGGKRIRPLLCFATAEALGGSDRNTAKVAAALELIHAYSLIHDDLPAMDDDALRRGKPTCHVAFDEATAILAGDALQALAFQQLADIDELPPQVVVELIRQLAEAAGSKGMVGGQSIDLEFTGRHISYDKLQQMHSLKTGALIQASVTMGATATNQAAQRQLIALRSYAEHIGLAFQIQDDILDVQSPTKKLGKTQGADRARNKTTYTSLLGLKQARDEAERLYDKSLDALKSFGENANYLRELAGLIVHRDR